MRWTYRRKAAILAAFKAGEVSLETLKREHGISEEELAEWQRSYAKGGAEGLRVKVFSEEVKRRRLDARLALRRPIIG